MRFMSIDIVISTLGFGLNVWKPLAIGFSHYQAFSLKASICNTWGGCSPTLILVCDKRL
jgi:hypothetical protein